MRHLCAGGGEAPGRTAELSSEIAALREDLVVQGHALQAVAAECGLERAALEQAVRYVRTGQAALGALQFGYAYGNGLRTEIELAMRSNNVDKVTGTGAGQTVTASAARPARRSKKAWTVTPSRRPEAQ